MGRDIFFSETEDEETRLAEQLRIGETSQNQNATNETTTDSGRVTSDTRSDPAKPSEENTGNDVLAKLLGSSIRSRMLTWLITKPKEQFFAGQLQEAFGANPAVIVREIGVFSEIGILQSEMAETESLYSLNPICPFLSELRGIILKTDGLIGKLREAISRRKGIEFAFIYGPFPNDIELGKNEIKLFIAGSAYLDLGTLQSEMPTFGDTDRKSIKITYLPVREFWKRRTSIEISLVEILEQPRIWLVGGEDALDSSSSSGL